MPDAKTPQPTEAFSEICVDRDFVEWHRGCGWCAVWVVLADQPGIRQSLDQARQVLGSALLPGYARQPHVTLVYRGLFDSDPEHPATEYRSAHLRADIDKLRQLALSPFTLRLKGIGSFSTVPYMALRAAHPGTECLQQLSAALTLNTIYPGWQYQPHVTLGHYAQAHPLQTLCAQLQQAGIGRQAQRLPVDQLWLMRYRSREIAGPLVPEGHFDLRSQTYQPAEQALLRL